MLEIHQILRRMGNLCFRADNPKGGMPRSIHYFGHLASQMLSPERISGNVQQFLLDRLSLLYLK
jgi:hypothetical protein